MRVEEKENLNLNRQKRIHDYTGVEKWPNITTMSSWWSMRR